MDIDGSPEDWMALRVIEAAAAEIGKVGGLVFGGCEPGDPALLRTSAIDAWVVPPSCSP